MTAPIKIDIYTIFCNPQVLVFRILALVFDELLGDGRVRWLIIICRILLLILDINWWLWLIFTRINDGVNKLEAHKAATDGSSGFFKNDWREPQIELMNAISNLTCLSIAKLHNRESDKLLFWRLLSSGIVTAEAENFH